MALSFTNSACLRRAWPGQADLLALHRAQPARYPHLLESVATGTPQGRYDILFAFPGQRIALTAPGSLPDGFFTALDRAWRAERLPEEHAASGELPPFRGGWFLYLGYGLAAEVEPVLRLNPDPALPTAFAMRCPAAVVYDHAEGQTWLVAEAGQKNLLEAMARDLAVLVTSLAPDPAPPHALLDGVLEEEAPERYLEQVRRARRYIHDGDIFQANLSRCWQGRLQAGATAADVYARLRQANPAPFAGLATWQDRAVISSSPERLLEVRNGLAQTRPIAGTRPRTTGTDTAMRAELIGHPKERAEHVMLIDLARNDLGRVCVPGSVRVSETMVLESYAHVHHIVSNVVGRPRPGSTPGQLIRAVFPGGTITGCPKVRCMQIIQELEGEARGAYTGSLGYLNRDGSLDLNILIRTLVLANGQLSLRAGAGIVADSIPEKELEETRAKARGLVLALHG